VLEYRQLTNGVLLNLTLNLSQSVYSLVSFIAHALILLLINSGVTGLDFATVSKAAFGV
jgi:hypothetical protein